jgi:hypothetical protein
VLDTFSVVVDDGLTVFTIERSADGSVEMIVTGEGCCVTVILSVQAPPSLYAKVGVYWIVPVAFTVAVMVKVIAPPDQVPEYGPPEVDEESNVSPEGNVPFTITMVTEVDAETPAPPKVLVLKVYTMVSPT